MNIAGFYSESITNGEGWRSVLFVAGCPHQCEGCQNPQTWDCHYGKPYNEEEIFTKIVENPFIDGLTLSGGEPMLYYKQLTSLVLRVKQLGLNLWCYTGYTFEELHEKSKTNESLRFFLEHIDVLVDGRFELAKKDTRLRFCGSSNQRIINVKASLYEQQCVLHHVTSFVS